MGPVMSPVMGPVMSPVMGPAMSPVMGPARILLISVLLASGSEALDKLFGSKTSYLRNGNRSSSPITLERCTPVQFYLVTRHGAKKPGSAGIDQMLT